MNVREKELPVITSHYELLKYIIPVLEKFPKTQKFVLADRIEIICLDVLEKLIAARFAIKDEKHIIMKELNLKIDLIRYLIRLSFENKYLSIGKYEHKEAAGVW